MHVIVVWTCLHNHTLLFSFDYKSILNDADM